MAQIIPKKILARQHEITSEFLKQLDRHLLDIVEGRATEMFEIRDVADLMHIHPTHLSNTIKLTTGKAPCYFFEEKILNISKEMLEKNEVSIHSIASLLTYDPSNFTKFFKRFTGQTPKQYREHFLAGQYGQKTETLTI
jgi:AraC family transcriptional regulator, regulatory protein of adaptative response / methylphosphotriester-DNA alkyltransferase methyltransferase